MWSIIREIEQQGPLRCIMRAKILHRLIRQRVRVMAVHRDRRLVVIGFLRLPIARCSEQRSPEFIKAMPSRTRLLAKAQMPFSKGDTMVVSRFQRLRDGDRFWRELERRHVAPPLRAREL